jgi:hypothetical protein
MRADARPDEGLLDGPIIRPDLHSSIGVDIQGQSPIPDRTVAGASAG